MNKELITAIETLQNEIDQLEENYKSGIQMKVSLDSLNTCRIKIIDLKKELQNLELSLLEELPKKNLNKKVF